MKQYLNNLKKIMAEGTMEGNRTDYAAMKISGTTMSFDMQEGFPIVTTKQVFLKALVGELIGFLRGYDNAAKFREFCESVSFTYVKVWYVEKNS